MKQVTAAVIIEDGRLCIARRPPGDSLEGLWELPGGKTEPGETPQACLQRELLEELDMEVEAGDVVATTVYEYEHGSFEMLAIRARRLSGYQPLFHDRCEWIRPEEAIEYPLAPADVELLEAIGW